MARVGLCRLSHEGVATVQQKYRNGRWVNIAAFCSNIGISRSTYYELIGRSVWFEQATIEDKLAAIGIRQTDYERLCEFKDREGDALQRMGYSARGRAFLPVQPTSFIGRDGEMVQLKRLLEETRLLTLVGAGGCGKTRLSLQLAADLVEAYPDGVWQIELAPLADPALVMQTVATALGLREQPGQPLMETLTDDLRGKTALLLLDNCEHLIDSCARLAGNLLRACPTVTLLATSWEALHIAGETVWRVPSLSLPEGAVLPGEEPEMVAALLGCDAVRLFAERARLQRPDFAITAQNGRVVAEVCRRLDGMPLAIELAAARLRSMTMADLHRRLDNLFGLMTGGDRTALPRQQTLRALIDWSYDLLEAPEKILLERLSVFSGGWTLEATATVCAGDGIEDWEALDLLTSLTDKSLVVFEERLGAGRYRLLETIRQYARERLDTTGRAGEWRGRHRDYFLLLAEEAKPHLRGGEQAQWFAALEAEYDNLRQVLVFCQEEPAGGEAGLRLGGALQDFWRMRGHLSEGRERLTAVLGHPGAQEPTRGRAGVLNAVGLLAWMQGDYEMARALYEESLAIFRELEEKRGIAVCIGNLGSLARSQGDYARAQSLQEEGLAICRELGDRRGVATSLLNLGNLASNQGDYERARPLYEESLEISRELGDPRQTAYSLHNLGNMAHELGDHARACSLQEESLTLFRELEDKRGIGICVGTLGSVAYEQGDFVLARSLQEESLTMVRELGDKHGISRSLQAFAALAAAEDLPERAARLWGAAEALRETIGSPLSARERDKHERSLAAARTAIGEAAFAATVEEGRGMTLEQGVTYALLPILRSEGDESAPGETTNGPHTL